VVESTALPAAGKVVAFVYSQATVEVWTTNHVERDNRRFRFTEKQRY
jgi:hypothetical protein